MKHGGISWINGKPEKVKDFSINLNPIYPEFIDELINEAIKEKIYTYYPDNYKKLKENIAEIYDVDEEYVGVFNGASEVINLLEPRVVPEPNYVEYRRSYVYFAEDIGSSFVYHLQGDKIMISNPNNPTGAKISLKEIEEFLNDGKDLVVDESFADIGLVESAKRLYKEDNLLIISTFTKSLSIPGLRIGFSIGKRSKELERLTPPWRVNSIAYYALSNVNPKEVEKFFRKSRETVKSLLDNFRIDGDVTVYKSFAPYVLVKFPVSVKALNSFLRSKGFLIRDCSNFVGLNEFYGRISMRKDYQDLVKEIEKFLSISSI
ncbi:histidinol-phosphate transaminase [Acidianus sp. HS-5]|uniref:aminotransferase class I/II-fold pyridoxal phosphate-dependent enzyme n=1 Tax=Acidianus sp. HS-5 TaxID=2886040 RepID=UPI001F2B0D14|nr:histidinol-phosphate transaminase [Acidianus sp. HS-5]BDC19470.1 aspartate aminotransferase [Acidianus sp. HS-5]